MEFRLTYNDYLWGKPREGQGADGQSLPLMSREEWDALEEDDKFSRLTEGFFIHSSDPRWEALAGQLGETDRDRNIVIGRQDNWNSEWMEDPDRYVDSENGYRFSTSGNESAQWQADQDFGIVQHGWMLPLAAAGIAAAGGAMGAGAAGAGETATGAGLFEGATASGGITTAGGAAGTAAGYTAPAALTASLPGITPTTIGGTLAAAPAITGGTAAAGGTGIAWLDNLGPVGRQIAGSAISGGAQALIGAYGQREAQQHADEVEEERRQDRIRRGAVPDFSAAFSPRPGVIRSRQAPGPISRTGILRSRMTQQPVPLSRTGR